MRDRKEDPDALGVYVHFPWCLKKCPYCDFLSVARERSTIPHAAYADAVLAELHARRRTLAAPRIASIFFGGGTPSLWEPNELGRVLAEILAAFDARASDVEITVECNPTSFDVERGRALAAVGVNRVSLGVQGLDAQRLAFLGRLHDVDGGLTAVRAALASGVNRVSADFIFGVSGQAPDAAAREARMLAELGTTHLSAYALTIEPGTQFGALAQKGRLPLLDDGAVADSFAAVESTLEAAGFEHYEISNYARNGERSLHNLGYWRGRSYLGLGCGAFGTLTRAGTRYRYRNTPSPERYLDATRQWPDAELFREGGLIASYEVITPATALVEQILLGLRLADGIDIDECAARLGAQAWPAERLRARERLTRSGDLIDDAQRLRIPRSSWLFADRIIRELI
ncbi:MAG TPA: radical SAM family heme chaperone HemW [Polyangiaceae bacterium]